MIILKLLGILLLIVVMLVLIAVIRTVLFIKPKTSEFESKKYEVREKEYAKKLSKMVLISPQMKYMTVLKKPKSFLQLQRFHLLLSMMH